MGFFVKLQPSFVEKYFGAQLARVVDGRWCVRVFLDHLTLRMSPSQVANEFNHVRIVSHANGAFHLTLPQFFDTFLVRMMIKVVPFHVPSEVILIDVTFAAYRAFVRAVLVFKMFSNVKF